MSALRETRMRHKRRGATMNALDCRAFVLRLCSWVTLLELGTLRAFNALSRFLTLVQLFHSKKNHYWLSTIGYRLSFLLASHTSFTLVAADTSLWREESTARWSPLSI